MVFNSVYALGIAAYANQKRVQIEGLCVSCGLIGWGSNPNTIWLNFRGRFSVKSYYPSVSKSNWQLVHVVVLGFFLINVRYIPYIPLKWWVIFFLRSWTSISYFSKLNQFISGGGQTNPYTGSLLDDCNPASKEPMYMLFHHNLHLSLQLY